MYKVERILAQNPCVSMLRGMNTCEEKLEDDKRALRSHTCKDFLFAKKTFEREDNRFNPVTILRVSLHKPSLFKLSFHNFSHGERFHDISQCEYVGILTLTSDIKPYFSGLNTDFAVNGEIHVIHIYIRVPIREF